MHNPVTTVWFCIWEHVFSGVMCCRDTVERTHGIRAAVMWVEANQEVLRKHWAKYHVLEV